MQTKIQAEQSSTNEVQTFGLKFGFCSYVGSANFTDQPFLIFKTCWSLKRFVRRFISRSDWLIFFRFPICFFIKTYCPISTDIFFLFELTAEYGRSPISCCQRQRGSHLDGRRHGKCTAEESLTWIEVHFGELFVWFRIIYVSDSFRS